MPAAKIATVIITKRGNESVVEGGGETSVTVKSPNGHDSEEHC
jgi:hypothetical protein